MNDLWIVLEDNHCAVSWWTDEEDAYAEALRIAAEGDCYDEDGELITNFTREGIDGGDYGVYIHEEKLNEPW